jgi:putative ABC transport system permease protein
MADERHRLADRVYRWLLRLFPQEFRGDFGEQMTDDFNDQRADAVAEGGMALARLWWRTLRGFAWLAPGEHLQILLRDASYGLRLMRRHSLATTAAIVTIALGIGANTAMFTVIKAILLDLPYKDPERLVAILTDSPKGYSAAVTLPQLDTWNHTTALEGLFGYWSMSPVVTGAGEARRVRCECASAPIFTVLGGAPLTGRTFTAQEDTEQAESVVVLHERFWTQVLNRDPNAVGRSLTLDGTPSTVIGIMPATFVGPRGRDVTDAWLPLTDCLRRFRAEKRTLMFVNAYGRLRPGESPRVVEAQLSAAMEAGAERSSSARVHLQPLTEQLVGDIRTLLLALFAASVFVLLIACANVASLLLGRADTRRRELAIRVAIGCSRAGIVRQLLTESLVFAMLGGAVGLLFAHWTLQLLVPSMPGWIPGLNRITLDTPVLAGFLVISLTTGLVFGVLPAWSASQVRPGTVLKDSVLGRRPARKRLRAVIVIAEVTLSVALLAGAALLLKTFLHLRPDNPGFDPARKLVMLINLPRGRYPDATGWRTFIDSLRQRISSEPAVESVEATSIVPLSGNINQATVQEDAAVAPMTVDAPIVTPGYVDAMRITILRGRALSTRDERGAPEVALVNETLARRLWPTADPVGRSLSVELFGGTSSAVIVGVVADVRSSGNKLGARPELYVAFAQHPSSIMRVIVTTYEPADRMAPILKRHVAAIDPALPVGDAEPLTALVAGSVATWRFAAMLLGAFAGIALILAALGLFAVVGCWVAERTSEIGVRMALGASRARVLRLFMVSAGSLTIVGLLAGIALAALTTRFLSEWLVDTTPLDRSAFAGAGMVMIATALTASYLAARRATTIDPIIALRSE